MTWHWMKPKFEPSWSWKESLQTLYIQITPILSLMHYVGGPAFNAFNAAEGVAWATNISTPQIFGASIPGAYGRLRGTAGSLIALLQAGKKKIDAPVWRSWGEEETSLCEGEQSRHDANLYPLLIPSIILYGLCLRLNGLQMKVGEAPGGRGLTDTLLSAFVFCDPLHLRARPLNAIHIKLCVRTCTIF